MPSGGGLRVLVHDVRRYDVARDDSGSAVPSHLFVSRPSAAVTRLTEIAAVDKLFSYLYEGSRDDQFCPICEHPLPGRTAHRPVCGGAS